MYTPDAL